MHGDIREGRKRTSLTAAVLLGACLAAASGCSSTVDEGDQAASPESGGEAVAGSDASPGGAASMEQTPGAGEPFPDLASVPERPVTSTPEQRQELTEGLVSDRTRSKYSDEAIAFQGEPAAPLQPPEELVTDAETSSLLSSQMGAVAPPFSGPPEVSAASGSSPFASTPPPSPSPTSPPPSPPVQAAAPATERQRQRQLHRRRKEWLLKPWRRHSRARQVHHHSRSRHRRQPPRRRRPSLPPRPLQRWRTGRWNRGSWGRPASRRRLPLHLRQHLPRQQLPGQHPRRRLGAQPFQIPLLRLRRHPHRRLWSQPCRRIPLPRHRRLPGHLRRCGRVPAAVR